VDISLSAELFSGLSPHEISSILHSGTKVRLPGGRIIFHTGEAATQLFMIEAGAVNFYRITEEGHEILLRRLAPGEVFGLGTLLPHTIHYLGTAKTVEDSTMYIWKHAQVRRIVAEYPRIAENALKITLEYIRLYSERHMAILSRPAEDRLAHTLARLGLRIGVPKPDGVELSINNDDLASLSDLGRFTASRLLKKFERRGALRKTRGKVLIHCPEKLIPRTEKNVNGHAFIHEAAKA
jgi:CRP/FNR family transcriptional regulator, nitrogen oxide reductase regulator